MDFNEIYEKFDKIKEMKDYIDYGNEIATNICILNSCPFDEETAKKQINHLVNKYRCEINAVAILSNNGKFAVDTPQKKSSNQIWLDLNYLNNLIPLFAVERAGLSNLLKQYLTSGE